MVFPGPDIGEPSSIQPGPALPEPALQRYQVVSTGHRLPEQTEVIATPFWAGCTMNIAWRATRRDPTEMHSPMICGGQACNRPAHAAVGSSSPSLDEGLELSNILANHSSFLKLRQDPPLSADCGLGLGAASEPVHVPESRRLNRALMLLSDRVPDDSATSTACCSSWAITLITRSLCRYGFTVTRRYR